MNMYVGVTDYDWYSILKEQNCDEVNFWTPGGRNFRAIAENELFLFKLHAPRNYIVGGGFFVKFSQLPPYLAWDAFGIKNGVTSLEQLDERINKYRSRNRIDSGNPQIGCIILTEPFFFDEIDWIPVPEDWSNSIVQGKRYSTDTITGKKLYNEVNYRLSSTDYVAEEARYTISETKHRLGQGAFRVAVADAYQRRCAITGEKTLPVLEAAHIKPYGNVNIRDVDAKNIPEHDVLCAGFPCQAFSKAGKQEGLKDQTRGTLFFEIVRILEAHKTKYIVLENVRNLVSHDHGRTWKIIRENLYNLGYRLTPMPLIVSPHQLGIPQLRERVVILGKYDPEHRDEYLDISIENPKGKDDNSIFDIIDSDKVDDRYYISDYEEMVLNAWDEFYSGIKETVIGFPIWSQYFNDEKVPEEFPKWKQLFVQKNKELYNNNREFIDKWLVKHNYLKEFSPTHTKMEWQAGSSISTVWEGVIQFRPSGIRIKKPTCFPALVAIVQIPIIGAYRRRLTVREAARLQSFPDDFVPCDNIQQAYKQFGNSVNVEVIEYLAKKLFEY